MGMGFVVLTFCVVLGLAPMTTLAAGAERAVTESEVRIGQWAPQTGPAAITGIGARGTGCYFDMINGQGGIHGRQIRYFLRDDAYQPPKTKAVVKELVEKEGVFAFVGGVGTACGMAVKDYLDDNRVPWVGPTSGSSHWVYPASKYRFGVFPLYFDEASALVSYAVKNLGKTRIAFFYQNDDYGKEALTGAEMALEKLGSKLVARVSYELADTDLTPHALQLKQADPDCVIMWVVPKHGAVMLGTAAKLGFHPQWMASSTLGDYPLMMEITKGLVKGMIVTSFMELPDSEHPLMVRYRKAQEAYAPTERWGVMFSSGFLFAEPLVEALRRAGRDLTVEKLVKALESLDNFKGIGPEITYGPDRRQGTRSVHLVRVGEDGTGERITDWIASEIDAQEAVNRVRR